MGKGNGKEEKPAGNAETVISRRGVVTGAALAFGGAVAAAGIPQSASQGQASQKNSDDPRAVTYRVTEHIRQFYARCRF